MEIMVKMRRMNIHVTIVSTSIIMTSKFSYSLLSYRFASNMQLHQSSKY